MVYRLLIGHGSSTRSFSSFPYSISLASNSFPFVVLNIIMAEFFVSACAARINLPCSSLLKLMILGMIVSCGWIIFC